MNTEFILVQKIQCTIRLWWVVALAGIVGSLLGYSAHWLMPPLYEAKATYLANIDLQKIQFVVPTTMPGITPTPYEITQYDEDMALASLQTVLIEVRPEAAAAAQAKGLPVTLQNLIDRGVIERYQDTWELRFRDADPTVAQEVTNLWAQLAFNKMGAYQASGKIGPYLVFELSSLAPLPQRPIYFAVNSLIMAGCLLGLVVGIILTNLLLSSVKAMRV